jgi:hypothetical protein
MGQINKGTTFVTGQQVTAQNLNNLVDNATLQPSAVTAQTAVTTVADTNLLLTANSIGTSLNKLSLANMVTSLNLAKTNTAQNFSSNITMVSGADIALTSGSILSLPAGALMSLSSGATLTLGQDPVSGFQAVTKNYTDNNFLSKITGGTIDGPLNVSGAMLCSNDITMIGTGSVLTLSADPIASLQAATKAYVDSKAAGASQLSQNGYQKFGNGLTLQWGFVATAIATGTTVTFPTPFTTECWNVLATYRTTTYNNYTAVSASTPTTTGFTAYQNATAFPFFWVAIGM